MAASIRFQALLLASLAWTAPASPLDKRYDLDSNGIPDLCSAPDSSGVVRCLGDNGVWSTAAVLPLSSSGSTSVPSTVLRSPDSITVTASSSRRHATTHRHKTRSAGSSSLAPSSTAVSSSSTSTAVSIQSSTTTTSVSPIAATGTTASLPTGTLPDPATFDAEKNSSWSITPVGTIYSSSMPRLGWDKGRTSVLNGTSFWNFGDVMSLDGLMDGFSMGAAFYTTPSNILEVNTQNFTSVSGCDFAQPDPSDPAPDPNGSTPSWGMDTSNVAEVTPGVGIGFVWEIWRSDDGTYVDRGPGMIRVTLGDEMPVATRTGPLLAGPDSIQLGLMTVLNAEGYIYTYTNGGPTGLIVGRAPLATAFNASTYEFLQTSGAWVLGIPAASDTRYGVVASPSITSNNQGSILYSNYLGLYMLFVGAYENFMNFYLSPTPYGPWSAEYDLLTVPGYGVNVHPEFSPGGSHQSLFISSGIGNVIQMWQIEFGL